jgi:hypothetical protein
MSRCHRTVAGTATTSHEVRCASEYYCGQVSGVLGCPTPPWRSRFRGRLRGFPPTAVPQNFRPGYILSCAFRPLQSLSRHHPPVASRRRAPPLGFPAPSRHNQRSPLTRSLACARHLVAGLPKPASFRPRRFSRPRRLPPPLTSRVCFTPQPRPGFALQGFPFARSRTGSSPAVALMSFTPASCHHF